MNVGFCIKPTAAGFFRRGLMPKSPVPGIYRNVCCRPIHKSAQLATLRTGEPDGKLPDTALEESYTSSKRTIPANLCLFLGRVEFPGLGKDLDDAIGKAMEKAARGMVGNAAAIHFQNVLGGG